MTTDVHDWFREPGRGKYARPERERRFLVRDAVPGGEAARLIEDRYLEGTSLRLRRVTDDQLVVHKLTQKVRPRQDDPSEVLVTNMYLTEDEFLRLSGLPGRALVKTRVVVRTASHPFAVDEFAGPLEGLRLAEVEVDDLADPVDLPLWLGEDVTGDDRFSGGQLAFTGPAQLRALLSLKRS